MTRREDVWAISRGIKKRRTQQNSDVANDQINVFCSICNDVISAARSICSKCDMYFHPSCLETNNSVWVVTESG